MLIDDLLSITAARIEPDGHFLSLQWAFTHVSNFVFKVEGMRCSVAHNVLAEKFYLFINFVFLHIEMLPSHVT